MNSRRTLLLCAIVGAALLVYANSLWNGFAYDDLWIIARNDRVHQLHNLRSILFTPYWPSFGTELGLYRPFTIFAYALEWAVAGGAPWFFHLINVLLHISACLLVFLIAEQLLNTRAAGAAAFMFAIHPLHTEAVANVVGQGELWAALCILFACAIWVRRPMGVVDWRTRGAVLLLYVLGLLFKESCVVLPGLLVLLDVVQQRVTRASVRQYVRAMAFLITIMTLILLAFLTLRMSVLGNIIGTDSAPGLPYLHEKYRLLNAFRAWPEFVRLLFFPMDLAVDYSPGMILPVTGLTPMVVLGMALVVGCITLMLMTPARPRAGLMAGWFLLTILPVSNLLFPIGVLIAERTMYLPSLSVCLLAGLAWDRAMTSVVNESRRLAVVVAVAITVVFGARTVVRNADWDSLLTVWHSLERDHPESYRSQWLRAINLWSDNKPQFAEQYFLLAYRIWPRDSQMLKEFGNFYIGQRRYDKAIEYLDRSRRMTPFVPQTWALLAYAYLYSGRPREALVAAQHASAMEGAQRALAYDVIGGAYQQLGRYPEAAGAWRLATRSRGGDLWLNWAMLARSLASAGRKDDALGAANVAYTKTLNAPSLQSVINKLKVAINSDCYPKGVGCDPLEGWVVAGATSVPAAGK